MAGADEHQNLSTLERGSAQGLDESGGVGGHETLCTTLIQQHDYLFCVAKSIANYGFRQDHALERVLFTPTAHHPTSRSP